MYTYPVEHGTVVGSAFHGYECVCSQRRLARERREQDPRVVPAYRPLSRGEHKKVGLNAM